MVVIHLAYTSPVNPPSANPTLTLGQCFSGLQRKVRHGEEFVPAISSTTVIEESVDPATQTPIVVRDIVFQDGLGPPSAWTDDAKARGAQGLVRERCVISPLAGSGGCKVDFYQLDGSHVENIISEGDQGELYMTYAFAWVMPHIDAGDAKTVDETRAQLMGTAKMAVEKSIVSIREMVKDGRIAS